MADMYRKSCKCGFTTNGYGTEQAAREALARHQQHCTNSK